MTTMFGRPSEPITEAVYALSYRNYPSLVVAYPSEGDWQRLYDPHGSRGEAWARATHAEFKRGHERSVTELLDAIVQKSTGQAILAELSARSSFSVMILPFDFLPVRSWSPGTGAVTKATEWRAEWSAGVPICGRTSEGKPFCYAWSGTGTGSSVDIYFTARRHKGQESADEVLLHELLHASRKVKGVLYRMPMGGSYGNQEEFLAVLAANIYRSEKGLKRLFDYHGAPIDPGSFLDSVSPSPRTVIALLRDKQPSLYAALARVDAPFNPVRQVDAEYSRLMKKIERI
jgi:hypothetical protein